MPKDLLGDTSTLSLTDSPPASARQHFCPECHKPMRRILGRKGPFWGCTGFPECRASLYDKDGKPSTEPDQRFRCPVCTRSMVRAENGQGFYWYCTGFNKGCKARVADDNGVPARSFRCKFCGQLLRRRKGRNGMFWGCSAYPECTHTWPDVNGEPDFGKPVK